MSTPEKRFSESIVVLTDLPGALIKNPLVSGFDPYAVFSRQLREKFKLDPEVTHIQYCCEGKAPKPYMDVKFDGTFNNIKAFQGLEAAKEYFRRTYRENPDELWCSECETAWETFEASVSQNAEMLVRGIAGIVAYVPVIGTAVAFILNTATSIATGKKIDQAVIDGVRGALPGQPVSTAAFDVAVGIARGEPIENVGINALPIDDEGVKRYLKQAAHVIRGLAEGQPITAVALDEIYKQLPPDGQRAMELAHRLINGEKIGDIAISTAQRAAFDQMEEAARAAKAAGQQAVNEFIAQVGYGELVSQLPDDIKNSMEIGFALGHAQRIQSGKSAFVPYDPYLSQQTGAMTAGSRSRGQFETGADKTRNDALAVKGWQIVSADGDLSSIRSVPTWETQKVTDDDWRRGFDIGAAVAEGNTSYGPGQQRIRTSLNNTAAMNGFDAARKLQYARTQKKTLLKGIEAMVALGRFIRPAERTEIENFSRQGAAMANADPQVAAARGLNADPRFKWGYDIGSAVTNGTSIDGPGQQRIAALVGPFTGGSGPSREQGSNEALSGYHVAQALQHGLTKVRQGNGTAVSGNATVAAGDLVTQGLAGGSQSADQKAATMAIVAKDALARQGAQEAIAKKAAEDQKGFFAKILEFLGLA